ncbi:HET-domain-containing protein, partial [Corynespora cassiicola Philippines]
MSIKQPLNSICHAIQRYIEETKTPAYYQPSPGGSLEDTVACGCKLCLVALRASGYQGRIDEIHDPEDEPFIHADVCVSGIRFSTFPPAPKLEVFIQQSTNNPSYNVIPVSTPIPASTSPEATIDRVADWLKTCLLNHSPLCPGAPTPSTVSTLPRRVLHVGTPSNPEIRLATPAPGEKGLYICLSHCWGGHQPLRTTLEPDTLTQFRSKIDWEDLPRTFQDAVLYTRALGIGYLWIDSLCIIQDSTEDWLVQSRAMASIYQNAILTLAATASVGPHDGLFRTSRPEHMATPLELAPSVQHRNCDMIDRASAPNIENGGCCCCCPENEAEHVKVYARTPLPHLQSPHPLLKRAWVLQERLLSPRILHFLADELAWECMGALECLCSALSISKATTSLPPDSPLAPVFRSHTAGHSGGAGVVPPWVFRKTRMHAPSFEYMAPAAVTDAWHELVEEYSAMRLSFGEDVFP